MSAVPDVLGQMTINEDGVVIQSSGDLSNNEKMGKKFSNMAQTAIRVLTHDPDLKNSNFRRLSIVWHDCAYVLTISNHKIFVVKRAFDPQEPTTTA